MKKICLILFIGVLFSCSNEITGDVPPKLAPYKLYNASRNKIENLMVNTHIQDVSYENLLSNRKSTYKKCDITYSYANVQLQISGKTYSFQPVDFVGETVLENGNYTYKTRVNLNQHQKLNIELIKD